MPNLFFGDYGKVVEMFVLARETKNTFFFFSPKISSYMKRPVGPPPSLFTCLYCGKPAHYRKNCPTSGVMLWGTVAVGTRTRSI